MIPRNLVFFWSVFLGSFLGCSDEKDSKNADDGEKEEDVQATEDGASEATKPVPEEGLSELAAGTGIIDPSTGIRPRAPGEIGVCRLASASASKKECMDFVGRDVTDLPKGDYVLLARLDVPDDKQTWPVTLRTDCRKLGSDKDRKERGAPSDVSAGSAEHGYRLWGMGFNVPGDAAWASDCTWTLSAPHPEGDNRFTGSWTFQVPASE